jgi:hypothetical protein
VSTNPADPDTGWLVAGRAASMVVGPERALAARPDVRGRVHLTEPLAALGPAYAEHRVAESGVRTFDVPWHRGPDGRTVAVHPVGGNQVSWRPDAPTELGVTPHADAHLTSVHVRFVLRHVTTGLLEEDLGGRSIHAVAAAGGGGVLAVAGPTRSGKTRLVNHLAAAGMVGDVVDDDCPVLARGGRLAMLVPRRHEVARAACLPMVALVLLTDDVAGVRQVDTATAQRFLERTARPWPAPWLPADGPRVVPPLPDELTVVAAPAQDEAAFAAVADLVGRPLSAR